MNWEHWLSTYGYPAIFIGTFLEGESILVVAGFFASRGTLYLPYVIAAAFFGSFSGDQLFFFIGRKHGTRVLARFPRWEARVHRIFRLFERWHTAYILGFRFLYGLRTLSPFVLGTSNVKTQRFFVLNGIGAITWATTIALLGFAFGNVVERFLGRAKAYEKWFLLGLVVVVTGFALTAHLRARRRAEQEEAEEAVNEAMTGATPPGMVPPGIETPGEAQSSGTVAPPQAEVPSDVLPPGKPPRES